MYNNNSYLPAIWIAFITFHVGIAVGQHVTTKFYKRCVKWVTNGNDAERKRGATILKKAFGLD
nr:MAG TPA: hypothetical protein [Caudoviricetes sp.]